MRRVRRGTLRVVTLSLLLVALLEALLVLSAAASGGIEGPGPFLVDLAQKVPWGVGVCTGLWLGLELGHGRALVAAAAGLVAAPIASLLLRAVAEGAHALAFAPEPTGPSPLAVAGIKGVEYACLGLLVAWLGKRRWARAHHHAAAGMVVAVPFGLALLALSAASSEVPLDQGRVLAWAVNEMLFPIGCALILFGAAQAERQAVHLQPGEDG
jgi:hypothetical protein